MAVLGCQMEVNHPPPSRDGEPRRSSRIYDCMPTLRRHSLALAAEIAMPDAGPPSCAFCGCSTQLLALCILHVVFLPRRRGAGRYVTARWQSIADGATRSGSARPLIPEAAFVEGPPMGPMRLVEASVERGALDLLPDDHPRRIAFNGRVLMYV